MKNAGSLLNQFLGTGSIAGAGGAGGSGLGGLLGGKKGLATGVVAGGLAGLLLGGKKPKKIAKSALKYGGAAVVGGLAYKAWQNYRAKGDTAVPASAPSQAAHSSHQAGSNGLPVDAAFLPPSAAAQEELAITLLKAMVAAAKADGHIDEDEREHISGKLKELNLSAEDQAFLQRELSKPVDLAGFAAAATSLEIAADIYMASLLVIDVDHEAERAYLAQLSAVLKLPSGLLAELHASVEQAEQNDPEIAALFA